MKYQKIICICFLSIISLCGVLTLAFSPREIAGGLVRGYIDAPEDYNPLEKVGNGFAEFESRISDYFIFRDEAINLYGFVQNTIKKDLVDDVDKNSEVVKLKNGYLIFKETGDVDLTPLGENIKELNSKCSDNGIDFVYLNKVGKSTRDKELLPDNFPYIYKDNTETVLKDLKLNGVNVLDMALIVEEQDIDKYSLCFKSDHHWTPETGIWVTSLIMDNINDNFKGYDLNTEVYDIANYNVDTYKKSFLGSQGKRVGVFYSEVDDFQVITPKDEMKYTLTVKDEDVYLEGSFEDVFIHREYILPDDLLTMASTPYQTYMKGNHSLMEIENKTIKNDKTALVVMDSFGCVTVPYLSQSFSKVNCIDLRHFSSSLEEYILDTKPDIVIYMTTNSQ